MGAVKVTRIAPHPTLPELILITVEMPNGNRETMGLNDIKVSRLTTSSVTPEQFEDDGDLAVIHVPTGQRYSTYPYERPEEMSEVIGRGLQNERGPDGKAYDTGQISDMALVLLREKLARRPTPAP